MDITEEPIDPMPDMNPDGQEPNEDEVVLQSCSPPPSNRGRVSHVELGSYS
jgi:hypothetical protein